MFSSEDKKGNGIKTKIPKGLIHTISFESNFQNDHIIYCMESLIMLKKPDFFLKTTSVPVLFSPLCPDTDRLQNLAFSVISMIISVFCERKLTSR